MNALERRASFSLALIYALRMLGLFMVLPVFTLEARHYEGGNDPTAVGLALGLYGLVQAVLQIPFGLAADRFGRKRVIVAGLMLFALGSVVAALATSVAGLAWGRALQGGGAISAAVSALLADQTRESVRTKGMALIGASIGLMFALSLVVGPLLSAWGGLPGIFWITSVLAVAGIAVVLWWTPAEVPGPPDTMHSSSVTVWAILRLPDLARLNLGVFILYTVQLATWVAVPALLIQAGVEKSLHGWVYLPAVLLSFVVMGATLFPMERRGRLRSLFLVSIGSVMLVQFGLIWQSMGSPSLAVIGFLLFVFFCGFNVLEASQPSLASRLAPAATRGTVLGIYNTLQSLGIFAGGALGGWLAKSQGAQGLFMACAVLMALWLVVAWGMAPPRPTAPHLATDHTQS
ncbi:MAG: MFS transporter [Limnohabitans sp.]|nr:MFS transporter [Limnohabitans sp.]